MSETREEGTLCAGCQQPVVPVTANDVAEQSGPWYCGDCFERERRARRRLREKLDLMHGLVGVCATRIGDLGSPEQVPKIEERARGIVDA
jgi:hypothetical protein